MNRAEKQIKIAMEEAAAHLRQGMSPNDALVKAANDNHLNPEMTKRAIEGFNIALTNARIAKATDKTASFPIVQADAVMDRVFLNPQGTSKDTPLFKEAGVGVDELVIECSPIHLDWVPNEKLAEDPGILSGAVQRATSWIQAADHQLSKAAQDVLSFERLCEQSLNDLVYTFQAVEGLEKFASFEEQIYSEYGEQARPTLNILHDLCGACAPRHTGDLPKVASLSFGATPAHQSFDQLMGASACYLEAVEARDALVRDFSEKRAELQEMMIELMGGKAREIPTNNAADLLGANFNKGARAPQDPLETFVHGDSTNKGAAFDSSKFLGIATPGLHLSPSVQKGDESSIAGQHEKARTRAIEQEYKGPKEEVDLEMDNVRRQAILRELMANDEIISRQNPHRIEGAYTTLLRIAPELTLHPAIVQSFLRSSGSQQAVDPFMAKQVAELQGITLKNKELAKGNAKA